MQTETSAPALKPSVRNTQGLRDILFDEIDQLRAGEGDPNKSMAVANLAKQIINVAKVEIDFHRALHAAAETEKPILLGQLQLGSNERV